MIFEKFSFVISTRLYVVTLKDQITFISIKARVHTLNQKDVVPWTAIQPIRNASASAEAIFTGKSTVNTLFGIGGVVDTMFQVIHLRRQLRTSDKEFNK